MPRNVAGSLGVFKRVVGADLTEKANLDGLENSEFILDSARGVVPLAELA